MVIMKTHSAFIVLKYVIKIVFSVEIMGNAKDANLVFIMTLEYAENVILNAFNVAHMMFAPFAKLNSLID